MSSIHLFVNSKCRVRLFLRATETLLHNVDAAVTQVGRYQRHLPTYIPSTFKILLDIAFTFSCLFPFLSSWGRGSWPSVGLGQGKRGQGGQCGQRGKK